MDTHAWPGERGRLAAPLRWGLVIGLLILAFWLLGTVILLLFASLLLATLLAAASAWVDRHLRLGYGWSLTLVVAAAVAALAGIGFALAPQVSAQVDQVVAALPPALASLVSSIESSSIGHALLSQVKEGAAGIGALGRPLIGTVNVLFESVAYLVFVFFMGLYLAAAPQRYARGLLRLVPPPRRERARAILEAIGESLKYFLLGRLFSMSIIAAGSIVGLWALGVPAAVALGLMAGVLSFVPYVGSAASGVAPFLLAYVQSPIKGVYVIVLFLLIHVVDGYVLVPLVQRRMGDLPPALTLAAQLAMGVLWGILGITVATPLAAALLVLVRMAYVEDVLHDTAAPAE